jgi:hypothetical protein
MVVLPSFMKRARVAVNADSIDRRACVAASSEAGDTRAYSGPTLEIPADHVIATPGFSGGSNFTHGSRRDCPAFRGIVSLIAMTGLSKSDVPEESNRPAPNKKSGV